MVNKFKAVIDFLHRNALTIALVWLGMLAGVAIGGCSKAPEPKIERLTLMPGQSAVLLEPTTVLARIPAQGNELYAGPVVIERGTVVIKPAVEGK